MKIKRVSQYSDELYDSVVKLLPQLDPSVKLPSKEFFQNLLKSDSIDFFIAQSEDNSIAGILTLAKYPNITGMKFWIEDVVVDGSCRGKGTGESLTRAALDHARSMGAKEVKLTSRPSRIAASKLYQKLGFVQYETNVYKYSYLKSN